jgi:hypothetical protein
VCGAWTDVLYVDGQLVESLVKSDCEWAYKAMPAINQGPTMVRGGRHELRVQADLYRDVAWDHSFPPGALSRQFVWSPMALSKSYGVTSFSPPPPPGTFAQPNGDGSRLDRTNEWAWVVSTRALDAGADANLVVYDDPWQGGSTGFSQERARSTRGAGEVDFVAGSASPGPTSFFPAVFKGAGTSAGYQLKWSDAEDHRGGWGSTWYGQTLGSNYAGVYELYMEAGSPLSIDLTRIGGTDDLALAIFPPTPGGVWSRDQALAVSTPYLGEEYDALRFTPTETGWHPLVVFRMEVETVGAAANFVLRVEPNAVIGTPQVRPPLFFSGPAPNPAIRDARFTFGLPDPGTVRIAVLDAQGREVRTLASRREEAGVHGATWDLRDAEGARVRPGLYWARFEAAGTRMVRRIAVLR